MKINVTAVRKNPQAVNNVMSRYSDSIVSKVGYPSTVSGISYPNGEQVSKVAYDNEFGTKKIPARPFMQQAIPHSENLANQMSEKLVSKVNSGNITELQMVKLISQSIVDVHKNVIVSLSSPPNSPATIKRKKSANPLIDTALMKNSLTYAIQN